ncbi:uncharacterized protein LOC118241225 [Electrophorus electricus]|uniref:uncharacterized protein LOC118241225 n=1 Tax=Electrophorus electricus TaxID=8005 RepID=UPI0015D08A3D|nr:uncharacterized protein LOC118241225 [Electrophorus electricus]
MALCTVIRRRYRGNAGSWLRLCPRTSVHRRATHANQPVTSQEPAPGAEEVSPDGHALVCAVCHCFLGEQWNSFERSRTPIEKRMYWLKRPYQCDARRVPQEWNITYDLERRGSGGSQNCEGNESDLSSFSDNENVSDQEADVMDRGGNKDGFLKASGVSRGSRDGARNNCAVGVKSSPDSQRAIRYPVSVYAAQETPKADGVVPPRRASKMMNHMSSVSLAQFQESLAPHGYGGPSVETPVQDNGIIMRNKQRLPERNAIHAAVRQPPADSSCNARLQHLLFRPGRKGADVGDVTAPLSPVGAQVACQPDADIPARHYALHQFHASGDSDASDSNEINVTSDDEREDGSSARERAAPPLDGQAEAAQVARHQPGLSVDECACYICGGRLSPGRRFKVCVQKQERAADEPFFPVLWLHTPPPGAVPLSPGGCTLVCASCHSSLMQQWRGFELAAVPVLQRLYVVPLDVASTDALSPSGSADGARPQWGDLAPKIQPLAHTLASLPLAHPAREACYLCGQDCRGEVRPEA